MYNRLRSIDLTGLSDADGDESNLVADEVLSAVTASMAVDGNDAVTPLARGDTGLVVDGQRSLTVGILGLAQGKAVVAGSAGNDLAGDRSGADLACKVGGIISRELEVNGLDSITSLAEEEVGDVDVL